LSSLIAPSRFSSSHLSFLSLSLSFFFPVTPATLIYTLSLHDALPISDFLFNELTMILLTPSIRSLGGLSFEQVSGTIPSTLPLRSEEHTSELQSRFDLVCRLLLEKKNVWQ